MTAEQKIGKSCTKCGEWKPLAEFFSDKRTKDGKRAACKVCVGADNSIRLKENADKYRPVKKAWAAANPDCVRASRKRWVEANPDRQRDLVRKWESENKDYASKVRKEWGKNNPEKIYAIRLRGRNKRKENPLHRVTDNFRSRISRHIRAGSKFGRRTLDILGYTVDELKAHIERQFLPGMSWDNYGKWHIDHIIPLAAHNYETPDDIDFKRAWALDNLQPLWKGDNLSKGTRLSTSFQPSLAFAEKVQSRQPARYRH